MPRVKISTFFNNRKAQICILSVVDWFLCYPAKLLCVEFPGQQNNFH